MAGVKNRPKFIFLDFDHTIFHTDKFFHVDMQSAFLGLGIDGKCWQESYEAIWSSGYTLEKHVEEMQRRSGISILPATVAEILEHEFANLSRYLFPDVIPFLEKARRMNVNVCLLSFGNPGWQRFKVERSGIMHYFLRIGFTDTAHTKSRLIWEHLREFYYETPLAAMIDNNPAELDAVYEVWQGTVKTYIINRVPDALQIPRDALSELNFKEARSYLNKPKSHIFSRQYPHIPCRNLKESLIIFN